MTSSSPVSLTTAARLDDLAGFASWLLSDVEEGLSGLGVDLPTTKAFREPGRAIAWDGEQLTIALQGVQPGLPGAPQIGVSQVVSMFATYNVLLLRYVPSLTQEGDSLFIPSPDELDAAAPVTMGDAAAMAVYAATLRNRYPETPMGFAVEAVGPQGQVAGTNLVFSVVVM